ncbi:MAG TPA: tetratricopeptide repeat protein [Burkholderiaceae bacterium]|jgi:predicted TPR repeat methyltransferase
MAADKSVFETGTVSDRIPALLQQALARHRQADYVEAEGLYLRVLKLDPRNFDALHLRGVVARQRGNPALAIELIALAIAVDPTQAAPYCNLGAAMQDAGDSAAALIQFDRALAIRPGYAMAHNNRGNALRNIGQHEAALQSYEEALRHQKNFAEAAYNRGTVLHRLERFEEAVAGYDMALEIKPDYVDALCNRGSALHMLKRYDEALASFDRALSLHKGHASALCNRGVTMQKLGRHEGAVRDYMAAIAQRPEFADAHFFLGNALGLLARKEDAISAYRAALACGADADMVHFALAAMGDTQDAMPQVAPASYVKNLFDGYAGHFDEHLVDVLHYRTPQRMLDALEKANIPAQHACIDLGCGTGLCGALLRPKVQILEGVDLSPKMLEIARQRGIYDDLVCAEVCAFLLERENCYDLAVAADVLVYIGDLSPLMRALSRSLRPGGSFVFSVEKTDAPSFVLQPSNRFAHSVNYLQRVAADAGMAVCSIEEQTLRQDQAMLVTGLIGLFRRET